MEAITVEQVRERRGMTLSAVVAYVGAAAFVAAAVWATLASWGVALASQPAPRPGLSVHDNELIYLRWLMTTQPQERLYTAIAIVAFSCLLATAMGLRGRFDRVPSSLAVQGLAVGVVLWVTERLVHLGADQAIGLLTTHRYPPETITGIGSTVDMITRAVEVGAFAMIGAGMLAFGFGALKPAASRRPGWGGWTSAIGLAMIVAAWATLAGRGGVDDALVAVVGVVLLPVWMFWSVAVLRAEPTG